VETTSDIPITGSDPRTVCAWVKVSEAVVGWQAPICLGWDGETMPEPRNGIFAIAIINKNWPDALPLEFVVPWGIGNDHRLPEVEIEIGTWYHVTTAYYDETFVRSYLDGNLLYSNDNVTPFDTGTSKLMIGKRIGTGGDRAWFPGAVDEVAIYDRALSDAEVLLMSEVVSVEPTDKLSITWGEIKTSR